MDRLVLGKLSYLPWHCYATVQIVIFENGQCITENDSEEFHVLSEEYMDSYKENI